MLTRYALFEGTLAPLSEPAFRAAVRSVFLPLWQATPGVVAVRAGFAVGRDDGAPAFPLMLAVDYPDAAALALAMASAERQASKAATARVLAPLFQGRIHHHVTETA